MKRRAFLFALAAALALPALARASEPIAVEPEARRAQREQWIARFRQAREAVAAAHERRAEALAAYKRMRHRRRERGEAKRQIQEELEASKAAFDAAQGDLKELFERARRAGVPPGWTRMKRGEHRAAAGPRQPPPP